MIQFHSTFFTSSIAAFSLACMTSGCLPDPNFPKEPEITLQSFELRSDGGRDLVIGFTDGDGNIGLAQGDTLPPFCSTCQYHQNLHCDYEEWQNGMWTEIFLDPNAGQVPFYYRIPFAQPSGDNPALNGTITVDMSSWHLSTPYDSLRFRITLYDRTLHVSNTVYTPAVLKP